MSVDNSDWTSKPIKADWMERRKPYSWTRMLDGTAVPLAWGPSYSLGPREQRRVHALQRERARELAAAMGFRTEVTDNHAAKIVEVLAPFIPGLTVESPTDVEPVPDWIGAKWAQPKVGAKVKWSESRKRELLADVERLKSDGRAESDRAALQIIKAATDGQGGPGVGVERLQNLLSEARRLPTQG